MRPVLLPMIFCIAVGWPHQASAQEDERYDCQFDRAVIRIESMRLDRAITKFTNITHCSVWLNVDVVKGRQTKSMKTTSIKGRYRPDEALARMLRTNPLKADPLHGGYTINKRS